jgi:exosortase
VLRFPLPPREIATESSVTLQLSSTVARHPWLSFLVWTALCCLFFWKPLVLLTNYSMNNDSSSHILLIPFIAAWLLYGDRKRLSGESSFDLHPGLALALLALLVLGLSFWGESSIAADRLTFFISSWLLLIIAGFLVAFGRNATKTVWFSLAFQAFAIPWPEAFLNGVIRLLQAGSADVAEWIFDLSGVPVLRDRFFFYLPSVSIEIAKECSGIRSSIALLILAVLVSHFAFSKFWKKVIFVCAGLLMMLIKNGVRIATLTLLAKYVDPGFLFGRLHHEGGVVFFLLGLVLLVPVYRLLRRGEPSNLPVDRDAAEFRTVARSS